MLKFFNHINIGYWNIHGVIDSVNNYHDNKVLDPDFSEIIKDFDLFCLSETHVGPDFGMYLPGYKSIISCRKISGNNRYFRGMCVFMSNCIKKGISS